MNAKDQVFKEMREALEAALDYVPHTCSSYLESIADCTKCMIEQALERAREVKE